MSFQIFDFETNTDVSLLANIQVTINNLKRTLQTGTQNKDTINFLFDFEKLRSQTTLTKEQIQNDIERLKSLFQTEPEIITRVEGFTNKVIETNQSLIAHQAVQGFNRNLNSEIAERENVLVFLESNTGTTRDTIGGAPQIVNFSQTSKGITETIKNNPLLLAAGAALLIL